ncbi:MAG: nucleoside kinase [Lachnospiraceae bacterium]|nr:nucleoside kinase [Lachnospiraceae bacterium]
MIRFMLNEKEAVYPEHASYADAAADAAAEYDVPIALAVADGRLRELYHEIKEGAKVTFETVADGIGYDAYRRSCSMLYLAACEKVLGQEMGRSVLHFSIGCGYYFTFNKKETEVTDELLASITEEMQRMQKAGIRFEKRSVSTDEARRIFTEKGMPDKVALFRTRIASRVNIYRLGDYEDYYYGYMLYDTSALTCFRLEKYQDGIALLMPAKKKPGVIPAFDPSEKLFRAQLQGESWAEKQNIGTVGDFNARMIAGDVRQTVLVAEALQEGAIAQMAATIASRKNVKFVMIAGPSSSGKTTFSQRLCVQLQAQGLVTHYIGTDNYFVNRDQLIPGPDGKLDFEALEAVDVEQFNRDMTDVLAGKTIRLPKYDFLTGKRVYDGETLSAGDGELLVIEGIHGLNAGLSYSLPDESKFRIYISALTQLNIDEHNRIPTTDGRLLRRIVRDARTRGYSASQTLAIWDSVRAGEEKNIFPYQESADVFFNSALPYEIAALKTYAQPLLFQVERDDPAWYEAKRLLKFLDYFIAIPTDGIPTNSIVREFIGGGCFRL